MVVGNDGVERWRDCACVCVYYSNALLIPCTSLTYLPTNMLEHKKCK